MAPPSSVSLGDRGLMSVKSSGVPGVGFGGGLSAGRATYLYRDDGRDFISPHTLWSFRPIWAFCKQHAHDVLQLCTYQKKSIKNMEI